MQPRFVLNLKGVSIQEIPGTDRKPELSIKSQEVTPV